MNMPRIAPRTDNMVDAGHCAGAATAKEASQATGSRLTPTG